ncbi:hypothetical protein SCACP_26970 [Sporomusa carbonis]|uniref:STAS domain-containing protein n=1 Tax=Sporomusa carbonis TaxID=3076075 RepID=UPI003A5D5F94
MNNQEFIVVDSQVIVNLAGNLQGKIAAQVRETMLKYIENGYYNFKVDFSNVTDINSTGLGMLVNIQKRTLQNGGDIIIHGLHGIVKAAFDRTRLTKAFNILDDNPAVA